MLPLVLSTASALMARPDGAVIHFGGALLLPRPTINRGGSAFWRKNLDIISSPMQLYEDVAKRQDARVFSEKIADAAELAMRNPELCQSRIAQEAFRALSKHFNSGADDENARVAEKGLSESPEEAESSFGTETDDEQFDTRLARNRGQKRRRVAVLQWPQEKFRVGGAEGVIDFLKRTWTPLLKSGAVRIQDLEKRDPDAFAAIPWPDADHSYAVMRARGEVADISDYLRKVWKDNFIDLGLVTMKLLRGKDKKAAKAIYNFIRLKELPSDVYIPTLEEANDATLLARVRAGTSPDHRLAEARYRRLTRAPP